MARKEAAGYMDNDPKKPIHGYSKNDKPICAAHTKKGDGVCNRPAGWGTNHLGWGRCKLHGGVGEGEPKPYLAGNQNAFKHGGRSRKPLYFDKLTAHEQENYEEITTDVLEQLDINIRLCEIKIDRFMTLLEKVQEFELGIVSQTEEIEEGTAATKDGIPVPISKIKKTVEKASGMETSLAIQKQIDLTQNTLQRLLDLKHRVQTADNPLLVVGEYKSLQKMLKKARERKAEENNGEEKESDNTD